ncbi:MAG: hypothetical protein QW727_01945 [Candidatus Pacearchaeota archaeon]
MISKKKIDEAKIKIERILSILTLLVLLHSFLFINYIKQKKIIHKILIFINDQRDSNTSLVFDFNTLKNHIKK